MTTVNVQLRHADCRANCQYEKELGGPSAVCSKRCYRAAQLLKPVKQVVASVEVKAPPAPKQEQVTAKITRKKR